MRRRIRLEPVTPENRGVCLALQVAKGQQRFITTAEQIIAAAECYPDTTLRAVVRSDGRIVGLMSFGIEPETGNHKIFRLLVGKEYQRNGYGRAAMRAAMGRIARTGATEVHIAWTPGNDAAEGLYTRLGFVSQGEVACSRTGGTKVVACCKLDS